MYHDFFSWMPSFYAAVTATGLTDSFSTGRFSSTRRLSTVFLYCKEIKQPVITSCFIMYVCQYGCLMITFNENIMIYI